MSNIEPQFNAAKAVNNALIGLGGTTSSVALGDSTLAHTILKMEPDKLMSSMAGFATFVFMVLQTYFLLKEKRAAAAAKAAALAEEEAKKKVLDHE